MKQLKQLTKKERNEYIQNRAVRKNGKVDDAATSVQYMIENNSIEEISDFIQHKATTTFYPGTPAEWFISVYEFNRLHEYCERNNAL